MKKRFSTPVAVGWLIAGSLALCLNAPAVLSAAAKPVILGLSAPEADKFNVEFQQHDRMMPVYRENGIQATLRLRWSAGRAASGDASRVTFLESENTLPVRTDTCCPDPGR